MHIFRTPLKAKLGKFKQSFQLKNLKKEQKSKIHMRVSHKSWQCFYKYPHWSSMTVTPVGFSKVLCQWPLVGFYGYLLRSDTGWWLLTEVIYKVLGQGLWLGGDGEDRHFVTGDGATQGLSPEEDLGLVQVLLPESQMSLSKIYRWSHCAQYKHLK